MGDLVESELDHVRLSMLDLLLLLLVLGGLLQSSLLVLLGLWWVLGKQSEQVLGFVRLFLPWLESQALVNWLSAGGTLSLFMRILFCLWTRMYLGHLTNLVRSLFGWMALPIPNFLGVLSKRPFLWTCFFLPAPLPAAPVFFFGATFLGCHKVNLPFGFFIDLFIIK
jgi:hypothetical protein